MDHDRRGATQGRQAADPPSTPGGSKRSRPRLWKVKLAKLTSELGVQISVSHLPPGTSKWNKIEHRLFSQISMNWRGRPLTSHEVIVEKITATTTHTGLTVHAFLATQTWAARWRTASCGMDGWGGLSVARATPDGFKEAGAG